MFKNHLAWINCLVSFHAFLVLQLEGGLLEESSLQCYVQCLVDNLDAWIIDWHMYLHGRAWRDTLKTFIPWFTKCTILTKFRHLSHIDMSAVGSLIINKWHICSYTHHGSLHFKPSSVVGFNGRLNGVESQMSDQSWVFYINSPSVAPWDWGWQTNHFLVRE